MKSKLPAGVIGSVQVGFEQTFWVHESPEALLAFAEKRLRRNENQDGFWLAYHVNEKNAMGDGFSTRAEALAAITSHTRRVIVQARYGKPGDPSSSCGEIADIFNRIETEEQLGLTPQCLGGGMIANPVTRRFKVKAIVEPNALKPPLVHVQANYDADKKCFLFLVRDEDSKVSITAHMEAPSFARMVEYLELVLKSYNAQKSRGGS